MEKLGLAAGMGTAAFTTAHIINQCIFQAAVSDKITENKSILKYKWRLGNVAYTVCGKGSPLLLIHDLKPESSSYEWKRVVKALAKNTPYTPLTCWAAAILTNRILPTPPICIPSCSMILL